MRMSMDRFLWLVIGLLAYPAGAQEPPQVDSTVAREEQPEKPVYTFSDPVRLKVEGEPIRVESPGFAAPCWADLDGDGNHELLVGQFRNGKIKIFRGLDEDNFESSEWLKAGDEVAAVPGVW